ncbi:MAG: anion transporter [Thermodesulfovibrionales bacterium]
MDKALVIFLATYAVIALGQPPLFRIDRTGAALIGASLMVVLGVLSIEAAYQAVDYQTVVLLFSMMIVVANLRLSGFFHLVSSRVMGLVRTPSLLLLVLIPVSGLLSALFINDTVCLALTPLVLGLTGRMGLNPVPFLLALCMASNIGSVATITGNPQNIMIGSFSQMAYARFTLRMLPIALAGLVVTYAVIWAGYRGRFLAHGSAQAAPRARVHRPLLIKSSAVSLAMVALFFLGVNMTIAAMGAATFLLITRRVKPERVYNAVDWRLLLLFVGLFIVVKGAEHSGLAVKALQAMGERTVGHPAFLVASSALLSNVVSNVPAVMLFKPLIPAMPDPEAAWLLLAMGSTLAGNLTILGSIANLIVIEGARPTVRISLLEYMKVGVPVTALSIAFGFLWLTAF